MVTSQESTARSVTAAHHQMISPALGHPFCAAMVQKASRSTHKNQTKASHVIYVQMMLAELHCLGAPALQCQPGGGTCGDPQEHKRWCSKRWGHQDTPDSYSMLSAQLPFALPGLLSPSCRATAHPLAAPVRQPLASDGSSWRAAPCSSGSKTSSNKA
jgi:hypothetical protein